MKAEIISIGNELLIGQVVNTNASYIAEELSKSGIETTRITVISDNTEEIIKSLKEADRRANIIIITGGLGPTKDDITRESLCKFFNTKLVENSEVLKDISCFFKNKGLELTDINKRQALVPEKSKVLFNKNGTSPGFWFEKNGKLFVSLPGVPFELKPMITEHLLPYLKKINNKHIIHQTILTHGIGESFLADKISDWEKALPPEIKLAYLPSPGIVRLRLSGIGSNYHILKKNIENNVIKLKEIIPEYIFGENKDTMQEVVGKLLKKNSATVSVAESCTGGMISNLLTGVPGASNYFHGSIIAYDNNIKTKLLNVDKELIEKHGAVSREIAESMALNIKKITLTNYGLATTGIAGPTGGSNDKPVGLVWVALATDEKIISKKFLFGNNRERNMIISSLAALNMLRLYLKTKL